METDPLSLTTQPHQELPASKSSVTLLARTRAHPDAGQGQDRRTPGSVLRPEKAPGLARPAVPSCIASPLPLLSQPSAGLW